MDPRTSETAEPQMNGARARVLAWLACAAALVGVGAIVFWPMLGSGISNVWKLDGLSQHFPGMVHTRQLVHDFVRAPFAGLPMWSFRLGLGGDLFGALQAYLADPFTLVAALLPTRLLDAAYEGLYFLRLLCAGLAAFAYVRKLGARPLPAIVGSVTYAFTTFGLFSALRHPHFATPLVWLPLVLLGIEYALERRKPYLLVTAVFLSAATSFYFFYQISIVAIIYALARFAEVTPSGQRTARLAGALAWVGGLYALGTALASFSLVPALATFFESTRTSSDAAVPLLATLPQYGLYLGALTSPYPGDNSFYGGFSVLCVLLTPIVVMRMRKMPTLALMLALFPLSLASPVVGSFMNGMSYPSYRFSFIWGIFVAAAIALVLSDARRITLAEAAVSLVTLAAFSAAVLTSVGLFVIPTGGPLVLGAVMWLFLLIEALRDKARPGPLRPEDPTAHTTGLARDWQRYAVAGLALAGVLLLGATSLHPHYSVRLTEFLDAGTALERFKDDPGWDLRSVDANAAITRIDKQDTATGDTLAVNASNDALVQDIDGLTYYYSIAPKALLEFFSGLDLRPMRLGFDYNGLDERAALEALAGVRYHVAKSKGLAYTPYGFEPVADAPVKNVSRNRNALPLGWVYHSVISPKEYAALTPLDRQQALLEGVVVDGDAAAGLDSVTALPKAVDVTYTVAASGTATLDPARRRIEFPWADAHIALDFAPVKQSELYLWLDGISFEFRPEAGRGPNVDSSVPMLTPETLQLAAGTGAASAAPGGTSPKVERVEPKWYAYYWSDDSALINLGYSAEGTSTAYLAAGFPADVDYRSLRVLAVPMADFDRQIDALAEEGLRDVAISRNTVSGTVTASRPGLLFLSVPYGSGWRATIDGAPATVARANVGFCGVPVSAGTHRVELRYVTPGLVPGVAVSALTLVLLLGLAYRRRLREEA